MKKKPIYIGRKAYERELEKISNMLNALLERRPMQFTETEEDLLTAKIYSQLDKMQDLFFCYDEKIREEQREIMGLIMEIAHQLRTPLANMETYLELLSDPDIEETGRQEYLEAVWASKRKIAFLVESFIKMSRLEHHVIQIHKNNRDLKATVLKAMFQVQRKAQERQVDLELQDTSIAEVMHDGNWLCEALVNLLDNSIKYSPCNSAVRIALEQNEMFVRITVEDEGIGIEEGEEYHIFQRFYRGKRATSQEGFGIGLYLAREILFMHDGFLKAKRKEAGLLLEVYLPLSEDCKNFSV